MKTRQPLPKNLTRSYSMHIRVRPAERRRITRDAKAAGLSLSEFFRQKVLARSARGAGDPLAKADKMGRENSSPGPLRRQRGEEQE